MHVLLLLLSCTSLAASGDLWLTVEHEEAGKRVVLTLPANQIAEGEPGVQVQTPAGELDLKREAIALRAGPVGRSRAWTVSDGATLTLSHDAPTGIPATSVALEVLGPKGNGLTLSFPIDPDKLSQARSQVANAVTVKGLDLDLDAAACDQLRRSPARVLLEVGGPSGSLRIGTR